MDQQQPDTVLIPLARDEAVVLFAFLRRFSDTDTLAIEDPAEQRALWNLCCAFEKHASFSFEQSYPEYLEAARARLREE
ncbi:MAG: hypothetical protein ABWY06_20940 [Pseudomonas sp.]|uniref:hypothetical protein n=1 Tax=Pseudomonas sp. TaxID=306 RepID=UPI003395B23F